MRILILALMLSGCANATALRPAEYRGGPLNVAEERGREFAYRRCSGCHDVSPDGRQTERGPPFKALARLYNPLSLERRFAEVSVHGSDSMPAVRFTHAEAEDLVAYVDTLNRP